MEKHELGGWQHYRVLYYVCFDWQLEKWWEQFAYLSIRSPHAPYMTMTGPGSYNRDIWTPKDGSQIERVALITWTAMKYWKILRQ